MTGARLAWQERLLEVRTARRGARTAATLLVDAEVVAERTGLGLLRLPLPAGEGPAAVVLVVTPLPGLVARTVLLVPRPAEPGTDDGTDDDTDAGTDDDTPPAGPDVVDLATAQRHPFPAAPGTLAARLQAVEERHPRLWASRHVLAGVGKVVAGLLGLAVLLQALVAPLLRWLSGLLPSVDLPDLPLPDVDVPWPDWDLPDVSLPGWVAAVLATAKFWAPVLVGVVLAAREVHRRRRPPAGADDDGPGDDAPDAHRRP